MSTLAFSAAPGESLPFEGSLSSPPMAELLPVYAVRDSLEAGGTFPPEFELAIEGLAALAVKPSGQHDQRE